MIIKFLLLTVKEKPLNRQLCSILVKNISVIGEQLG